MNKKFLIGVAAVAVSLTVAACAFTASATNRNTYGDKAVAGQSYIDENNDGICDNRETVTTAVTTTKASVTASSVNQENTTVSTVRPNYVDENNDGICDNRATAGNSYGNQDGSGRKNGNSYKNENSGENTTGPNYVDENNDGICDNRGNAQYGGQHGNGKGNGRNR